MRLHGLVKKLVSEFLERREKSRGRLLLALIAALRLRERGEPVTAENVAKEARAIIKRGGMDWGVAEEEMTEALAADLLEELVEMGVLEPEPGVLEELGRRYRVRGETPEEREENEAEILHALAPLLLRAV